MRRASTRRVNRSRSSTGSGTASCSSPGASATDPDAFIANRDVFGDLADDKRFVTAYRSALASLHQRGARATLESLICC